MSSPVNLSASGPPETVLDPEPQPILAAIESALALPEGKRSAAVAEVVANAPRSLMAWAAMGELSPDRIEAYAYFRVGYHRGLDKLRQSGWRGSGYVRWEHPSNRGFLRCVHGLERCATEIGEADEEERCAVFLRQLDPSWPPAELS